MNTQIESLRSWSHLLYWLSIALPLAGVVAGVVRYYVEREVAELRMRESRAEVEKSRLEFLELKVKTAPRHISPEQRRAMLAVLSKESAASIAIVSRLMDGEGSSFAEEIGSVFTEAGWSVEINKSSLNDFEGYSMAFVGVEAPPPETESIVSCLRSAGIELKFQKMLPNSVSSLRTPGVAIFIGRR